MHSSCFFYCRRLEVLKGARKFTAKCLWSQLLSLANDAASSDTLSSHSLSPRSLSHIFDAVLNLHTESNKIFTVSKAKENENEHQQKSALSEQRIAE